MRLPHPVSDLLIPNEAAQPTVLKPVLDVLADYKGARILTHLFSNGGSYKLVALAKAYLGAFGAMLPINALVLDSAPGTATFGLVAGAISTALPKAWYLYYSGLVLVYIYTLGIVAYFTLTRRLALVTRMFHAMNETQLITTKAPRLYIFSKEDSMMNADEIVVHGREAQRRGYEVDLAEFSGSGHVAHMMLDSDRYWKLIGQLWEGSSSSTQL